MSVSSEPARPQSASFDLEAFLQRIAFSPWLSVVILCVALLQQMLGHMNCDTSWFITFAEKVVSGERPYIDVSDPNPPAAFLAYVPSVLLAHGLGSAVEPVVIALTFGGALLSIFFAGAILNKAGLLPRAHWPPAFAAVSFCLLVVPAFCFAEREHLALILFLPAVALLSARASGAAIALPLSLLAGLVLGMGVAFKPYFALPFALMVLSAALRQKSWRLLFAPECFAAAGVLVLYVAAIVHFTPAYFSEALPLITDIYVPARESLYVVLRVPAFLANALLLVAIVVFQRGRVWDARVMVLGVASLGFLATFLIQSKGWMNHAYPGTALALLAGAFCLLGNAEYESRRRFGLFLFLPFCLVAPSLFGSNLDLSNREEFPGVRAKVAALGLPHPKIAALAEELDLGHPLVRQLGGIWVGRQNCLWVSYEARYLLAFEKNEQRRARLEAYIESDERMFAQDVRDGRPDVLLVETPQLEARARAEPALRDLFDAYTLASRAGGVSIWKRNLD
jgi:hypothetical protein